MIRMSLILFGLGSYSVVITQLSSAKSILMREICLDTLRSVRTLIQTIGNQTKFEWISKKNCPGFIIFTTKTWILDSGLLKLNNIGYEFLESFIIKAILTYQYLGNLKTFKLDANLFLASHNLSSFHYQSNLNVLKWFFFYLFQYWNNSLQQSQTSLVDEDSYLEFGCNYWSNKYDLE